MNYILLCFIGLVVGASCERTECQNPPPTLRLMLMKADGTNLITNANAQKVSMLYTRNGQLSRITDLYLSTSPAYTLESYEINTIANQLTDTTHFYIAVDSSRVGPIQLKTYEDTSPCDGWTHINELRFAGQVIPYESTKSGYTMIL